MTSTSPAFLPAGEEFTAAPKNITHVCFACVCVHVCTQVLVWDRGADLGGLIGSGLLGFLNVWGSGLHGPFPL
jgi:hypothetical protein